MVRKLGIDFGLKRIGLSISDETATIASPVATIKNDRTCFNEIMKWIKKYEPIDTIVIGLPLHLSGHESDMSKNVRLFATQLEDKVKTKIVLWDERLTSAQIDRVLREAEIKRKKRAQLSDVLSAVLILQSYLDAKHN